MTDDNMTMHDNCRHGHQVELEPLARSFRRQWAEMNRVYPHFGSTTPGMGSLVWWHTLVKVSGGSSMLTSNCDEYEYTILGDGFKNLC